MRKKIIRITTADISLDMLLKGQLAFLNEYYEVVGVSSDTGLLKNVGKREGIRVVEIPMHREISLKADFGCLWKLYKLFRRERPFIIHANTPKGSLLAMVSGWMAMVPNRIYTVTGLRYQGATGVLRFVLKSMERITCLFATKVIPEGEGVRKALRQDHITLKKLQVVHNGNINGIDTAFFSPESVAENTNVQSGRNKIRQELGLDDSDFAFIFVGRIVKDKGMDELASALRRLIPDCPKCKLILVGPFETELDPLTEGNEEFFKTSPNVKYVGYQADIRKYLLAADALVFPSYREGFPNVVLQAGAMGLPSIVTNINGCNEIIIDGINGKIISAKNGQELYDMMKWFLESPGDVSRLASKSRMMVQTRYEQNDVWKALLEMYQSLSKDV